MSLPGCQVVGGLKHFPLMHQIADLPHQRLMLVDDRLGPGAILIEARRRHLLFDGSDGRFTLRDPRLELFDPVPARLDVARALARVGVRPLSFLAR